MWITLTDSGLGGGTSGTVLHVNSAKVFWFGASVVSGSGSSLEISTGVTLEVQEAPTAIAGMVTDGKWLGFVPGWAGAPAGLVYVNVDNVLYFTANLSTYHVPTGTTLYWISGGNYQVANTPSEVVENSKWPT